MKKNTTLVPNDFLWCIYQFRFNIIGENNRILILIKLLYDFFFGDHLKNRLYFNELLEYIYLLIFKI